MIFEQALMLFKKGMEIRRVRWVGTDRYISMGDGDNISLSLEDILASDWIARTIAKDYRDGHT